jgi:hypothetical protein
MKFSYMVHPSFTIMKFYLNRNYFTAVHHAIRSYGKVWVYVYLITLSKAKFFSPEHFKVSEFYCILY